MTYFFRNFYLFLPVFLNNIENPFSMNDQEGCSSKLSRQYYDEKVYVLFAKLLCVPLSCMDSNTFRLVCLSTLQGITSASACALPFLSELRLNLRLNLFLLHLLGNAIL